MVTGTGVHIVNAILDGGTVIANSGGSGSLVLEGETRITGDVVFSAGSLEIGNTGTSGTLIFNQSEDYTLDLAIAGSGGKLIKQGDNTLILNGVNTYTGETAVSAGTLLIGGTSAHQSAVIAGNAIVHSGGTLGGYGTLAQDVTINSGGTITGQLTIGETLTIGSGGIYSFTGNADGTGDHLQTGSAVLENGSVLALQAGAGTWAASTNYTILDSTSSVNGQFTEIENNTVFLNAEVDYSDPTRIVLTLKRNSTDFKDVGDSPNQGNVADAIEKLGEDNQLYKQIVSMDAAQAQDAYDNLSGEIHGNVKSALIANTRYVRNAIYGHLDNRHGVSVRPEENLSVSKFLWADMWGHEGHLKSDGNAARTDNKGFGFIVGADLVQIGKSTAGLAIGYEQSELKTRSRRSSESDIDSVHLMAYGKTEVKNIQFKGGIGYSWLDIDTTRNINVGSVAGTNKADYHGEIAQAFVQAGHDIALNGNGTLTPYAGLNWQWIKTDSFHEKGSEEAAASRLHGDSQRDDIGFLSVGVKGQWKLEGEGHSVYGDVSWQHALGAVRQNTVLSFGGGDSYRISGNELDRDAAQIRFGAKFGLRKDVNLSMGYDGWIGENSIDHGMQVRLDVVF